MGNYNYIFFDLDGTLTDSAPGIRSFRGCNGWRQRK